MPNNRNYVCTPCRTATRYWGKLCPKCGAEMLRVNRVPRRTDDAGWSAAAAEIRERQERHARCAWALFVETCEAR